MHLKEIRKRHGLTMREVADMARISESGYCLIESGKRTPRPVTAKRLARVLGISIATIYDPEDGSDEPLPDDPAGG